jgi:hypothetical protein
MDNPMRAREVLQVDLPKFWIKLRDKHAFVAEATERNVKPTKAGE